MRLFLIRHGQTPWNLEGRAQGHTDVPLDDEGRRQARCLADAFATVPLDDIITSDLQRSAETAAILAAPHGLEPALEPRLRERSYGDYEGERYEDVARALHQAGLGQDPMLVQPPSGESHQDVWNRIRPFADGLQSAKGVVAVVAHGGSTAQLLAILLRGSPATARGFRFGNTAVTELKRRPDGFWVLNRYADTSHLDIESAPMVDIYGGSR